MSARAITGDGAFLEHPEGVVITIVAAHPVSLDNTAALRLMNVNHILVCEVHDRSLISTYQCCFLTVSYTKC